MNTDGIVYRPQYCTYIIRVGKTIVEVDAWALKQAWNVDQIESILRSGTDAGKKNLLDSIVRIGGRIADDLGDNATVCGNGYTSSYDPIDALYRGAMDPRDNVVACAEMPKPTPDYDPKAMPKIYYNDRFPSVPARTIIDEAIKLLNAKKNLHMTKVDVERAFDGFKLILYSDMPTACGMGKNLAVLIKHSAFDRAHGTGVDADARLMAKLDTNTYIKLRIAFLLYEALKTCEYNKQSMDSDIFKIIYSD